MAEQLLVPLDDYLKVGLHIGNRYKTADMAPFIYKIRPDGLPILNVEEINRRVILAINVIKNYKPEEILVVCRRENGWKAVKLFSNLTGVKVFAGRYPPGILTNPDLEEFMEVKLIIAVDPWPDKNVVEDAFRLGVPVVAFCDTNNEAKNIDLVVPCNNKGKKSLGLLFWIIAREYMKSLDLDFKCNVDDFVLE